MLVEYKHICYVYYSLVRAPPLYVRQPVRASKSRIADLRLDKARRSYRSSAASSEDLSSKMASFSSPSGDFGESMSLTSSTSIGSVRGRFWARTILATRSCCRWGWVRWGLRRSAAPIPAFRHPRWGRRFYALSSRPPARVKDPRELKHSSHDETHFAPREPFPLQSWARCSPLHWRDWRAVASRWSRSSACCRSPCLDISEIRVLDLLD
jgi:hypothetical protein